MKLIKRLIDDVPGCGWGGQTIHLRRLFGVLELSGEGLPDTTALVPGQVIETDKSGGK